MSNWRQHMLIIMAYLALAIVMTWPLTLHLGDWLGGGLDPLLQSWILAWNAHALRTNPLAIWQAPIFFPYPDTLAYTDHHLPQMILAAPVIWATGNPALAHNLLVLLSYALTGWAVALLAQDLISADRPVALVDRLPAFVAGAAFAFGSFRMAQFVHLQMLQTAWLPLALLFLRRTLRTGSWRDGLACGFFVAVQSITALYFSYFAALALGLYGGLWVAVALWQRIRQGTRLLWRPLLRLAAGALLAAVIVVPLTLPYIRVYQSLGIVRSARELENWSAPLQAYLAVDPGNRLLGTIEHMQASGGEFALFPGIIISILALAGLLLGLRRSSTAAQPARIEIAFLILLALVAFVLSLGTSLRLTRGGELLPIPLPYGLLYERLPGFGALRVPARWGMLVGLALCLLAACGLAAIRDWSHTKGRRKSAGSLVLPSIALALILAESSTALPLTTAPDLRAAPPIYSWLAQPAQSDLRAILELPSGRTQRGEELEKTMRRQYVGALHWRPLATGYSGLIPFGTTDLLGRAQGLPDEEAIQFLQLAGIDTLILHRDQYPPDQFQQLVSELDATPLARKRAEIGEALVYTLLPFEQQSLPTGASVFVSGDERAPGLPALALVQRWSAAGVQLYGPGRARYYSPLAAAQAGQVFDYGLLADSEEPRTYGFAQTGLHWRAAGLALYARDPALRASLELGIVPNGQFYAASPAALELTVESQRLIIPGRREVSWAIPINEPYAEVDLASLTSQDLLVGDQRMTIQPGTQTLTVRLTVGQSLRISGTEGQVALLRIRIRDGAAATQASTEKLAITALSQFEGSRLSITAHVGGSGSLLIEARGAAARDDRPVLLFTGIQPIPAQGSGMWSFSADLLNPAEPWIQQSGQAEDGRYQVSLKDSNDPAGPGLVVAKFNLRSGKVVDAEIVALPLTELR